MLEIHQYKRQVGIIQSLRRTSICMRMISIIQYLLFMLMAYKNCSSKAFEEMSRNPLEGSRERWPGDRYAAADAESWGGAAYVHHGDKDLTRLLDVGACRWYDSSISFVPALDGTSPHHTLCQDHYSMKFVLFDLQLVQLKAVDAVGGSFRAELQMILHWIDSIITGSDGEDYTDDCSFLCDTDTPRPLCCDKVWVPPLHLSGCEIQEIKSSTPTPKVYSWHQTKLSYSDCFKDEHEAECYWRRLWYLNIDVTCASNMDFHNFPFDVQSLTIDLLNPYASRTWFQLTKGFLKYNIDEDINNINLSPDGKIPGWYVKDLGVSGTCGTSESWKQTFLTQDILLRGLTNHSDAQGRYDTQYKEINTALSPDRLKCLKMKNFQSNEDDEDFMSPTDYKKLYKIVKDKYDKRVQSTLQSYRQCIERNGRNFSWNMSVYDEKQDFMIPNFGYFNISDENINRSFNILDLQKDHKMSKVWFPCAISAVANLTTPGIRVTILVQRYRKFYVMKLILPTIACVAFSFAAFGLHPKELMGRLAVVVPSAIALTALQTLVVSTDLPPVAYIAPSTYIILFSYLAQLLISFESVLVKCLNSQKRPRWWTRGSRMSRAGPTGAPTMDNASIGLYYRNTQEPNSLELTMQEASISPPNTEESCTIGAPVIPIGSNTEDPNIHMNATRIIDLFLMLVIGALYIMSISIYTLRPMRHSKMFMKEASSSYVSLWQNSTN